MSKDGSFADRPKVVVMGVDGCSLGVIKKLVARGALPNFARLINEGACGPLRSTIPPASPAAWTTFQTGKDPGKHGIFDFFRNNPKDYTYTPVNATFMKEETFWMRLSRIGRRVGVVNFLFTYPPPPVRGFVISGKETPSESVSYTYPAELKNEILDYEPGYEVEPFKRVMHTRKFLKEAVDKLAIQEKVNRYLISHRPVDLFMNMFSMPDVMQHVFWRHMDETHPLHDPKEASIFFPLIQAIFEKLDECVAHRLKLIEDQGILVVLSDHGGCGVSKIVHLNKWLQNHRLLNLIERRASGNVFRSLVMNQLRKIDRALVRFDRWGLRRLLKYHTQEMRRNYVKTSLIDWSRTKAYMGRNGESGIFCNLKGREKYGVVSPGEEYESVRDEIVSGLSALSDPATGDRVFAEVYKREELYQGSYVEFAPDVMVETADRPYQEEDHLLCRDLFRELTKRELTGKHHPEGVLMIAGRGIRKGQSLQGIHIRDVAPTLLYMMNEKIPMDMDGRVITELFASDVIHMRPVEITRERPPSEEAPELIFNADEAAEVEARLKDLGYL